MDSTDKSGHAEQRVGRVKVFSAAPWGAFLKGRFLSFTSFTLLGVTIGVALMTGAAAWMAGDATWLVNVPGLLIVIGGVFVATLGSFSGNEVVQALRMLAVPLRNEQDYLEEDFSEIENMARLWYSMRFKDAERAILNIKSPFLKLGVQLVIDNMPPEDIKGILEWRIERLRAKEYGEAHVFRAMGSYAPAFGLLGTLMGLASMLSNMKPGNLGEMGAGLAVALVTTFYGLVLANLVFKPMATKLERRTEQRVASLNLIMGAISLLHKRKSPAYIKETLHSLNEASDKKHENLGVASI